MVLWEGGTQNRLGGGKAEPRERRTLGLSESPLDAGHQEKSQDRKAQEGVFLSGAAGQHPDSAVSNSNEQETKQQVLKYLDGAAHTPPPEKNAFLPPGMTDRENRHEEVVLVT